MPKPVSHTDVTPGTTESWQTVDVTTHVGGDAGSVAGVILQVHNPSVTEYQWGVRKSGSTDTLLGGLEDDSWTMAAIGVDGNDEFECYVENASLVVYLVGYITTDEGHFFDNAIEISPAASGAYTTVDLSSHTDGGESASCAFILAKHRGGGSLAFAVRPGGSSHDVTADIFDADLRGVLCPANGSSEIDIYGETFPTIDFHFVGYLTSNVTLVDPPSDQSLSTTGSYVDVDLSSIVGGGDTGAIVRLISSDDNEYLGAVRKKGDSHDIYDDISDQQYAWVALDASQVFQAKIEGTGLDLYVMAGTAEPAGGGGTTHTGSVSEGAESGETFAPALTARPSFSEGALSNDAFAARMVYRASIDEGAAAGDSNDPAAQLAAEITDGSVSGDALTAVVKLIGAITEGAEAGESWAVDLIARAELTEGAHSGSSFDAVLEGVVTGQISEGALSGDSFTANLIGTIEAAISEGSAASAAFLGALTLVASIEEGAASGDTFEAAKLITASVSEGAVSGDAFSHTATLRASITEGALAGATFAATATLRAALTEGAVAGDAYTTPDTISALTATVHIAAALSAQLSLEPALTADLSLTP